MKNKYDTTQKQDLVDRYLTGQSVSSIVIETGIPRSSMYSWIKKYNHAHDYGGQTALTAYNFRLLTNKVARLKGIIEIINKAQCTSNAPLQQKLTALESLYGQYNVHMLCEALDVARGTFYNHVLRNKRTNTYYSKRRDELRIKVQEIYDDSNQIFGAAKINAILKCNGYAVSEKFVLELMRDMGLVSIRQNAKDLFIKERKKYKNYLNQEFHTTKPNDVWVSDITYFRYNDKSYYICVIIDLFSRRVVGHKISHTDSTQLAKSTFTLAYKNRKPDGTLIFHTDRGKTYRAKAFCDYLEILHVTQSFSRAYVPYDNSVAEAFFASMKREELYRTKFRSEREFRNAVDKYIVFYNTKRPHRHLKYRTPEQAEADYIGQQKVCG